MKPIRALLITLLILTGLFGLYLFTIHPGVNRRRRERLEDFMSWDYAHRGLWNLEKGIPENSMPAFQRAVEKGYAIELDVHLTSDKKLVVFHDDNLHRVCGVKGKPEGKTLYELQQLKLSKTDEHMPAFQDVLKMVDGKVPLLIELKLPTLNTEIVRHVYEALKTYDGPYLIESFNPFALSAYKKLDPDVLTGQLAGRYPATMKLNPLVKFLSSALFVNVISRPDFISYNFRTADGVSFQLNRKLFHAPTFVWTVRSEKEYKSNKKKYDAQIFEKFEP